MKPEAERQTQFIEELRTILHQLPEQKPIPFQELYTKLQPTFHELRNRYNLEANPTGTNTELIMFQSTMFSRWYNNNVYSKKKYDPSEVLTVELEKLFDNNKSYTYPDGRTIYYDRGQNIVQRIKRDILQEFDMMTTQHIVMFRVRHLLNVVTPRFAD